jgi:type II secretory pathway component PulK
MKKIVLLVVAIVVVLAGLALAGYTYAQAQNPQSQDEVPAAGWMPMGGMRGFHGRMTGRFAQGAEKTWGSNWDSPMHQAMVAALATEFGISAEDLQTQIEAGQTPYQVGESLGFSAEELQAKLTAAHQAALDQLVADGVISAEQAEWMASRHAQMAANGFAPGSCHGSAGRGGMMGWGWQNQK